METYKGYWRRRAYYESLDGRRRRREGRTKLGDAKRGPRLWGIRMKRRLRVLRHLGPRRLLGRIRDGYMRAMLALASSGAAAGGGGEPFGRARMKEYDKRTIVKLYKEIVARGNAFAAANGR